jgi:amino acid transporter
MSAEFYSFNGGDPWSAMAEDVLPGIGGLLVILAILNSSVANANSGATAATRSLFAMGRTGLLPRWFAAVHPTFKTPSNATNAQALVGVALTIVLGLILTNSPLNVYVFIGYTLGLLFAAMYIAVNAAAIGYYWRRQRNEFNIVKHGVVPVFGMLAMIPAFLSILGGLNLFGVDIPPLSGFLVYVPWLVFGWIAAGVVLYFVLRSRNAAALSRVGEVMGEA